MKRIKRATRIIFATCLMATLLCGTCLSAFAADVANLDLGRTGNISVSLYSNETQAIVSDGALTLYEVADLTLNGGDMIYVMTDAFSGYDGSLDVEEAGLADVLAEYVIDNGVEGTEVEISGDGNVEFTDLTLGLYLVVQTTESSGYYPIDSFLVTVPIAQGSVWAYSVEASPKVEVYPESSTPPGSEIPGEEPETPPGTEPPGTETVTPPGTDSTDTETVTPPGTDTGDTAIPTPTTTPTVSSGTKLPQTGQLVWPVALFAACGGMFFIIGGLMRKRNRVA